MDHMVRHFLQATAAPLYAVIRMASLTPARRVGIAARTGSIESGKRADLLVLSPELHVQRVFLGGVEVPAT
jgi:N-acetylglucosamine-6-phosphate deacetylase